ncbi:MAG: cytochrome c biogenesis protein CcdA [Spirochaetales bacterium]|nr:cytochrome c biogenesis protein CcdA [Spirochaetales bacterium]
MLTENLNVLIAFAAGVLSFLSPCILPLIPSYLSLVGGVSYDELSEGKSGRLRVFLRTLLFVLGFSIVFILLGVLFSGTGGFLSGASRILNIVAGSLVILLGLNFVFNFLKFMTVERRVHVSAKPAGSLGAILLGMAFGAGWTPCVGPILASILFLAGSSGQVLQGSVLLAFYSLGLGVPFLLAGLFFAQFLKQRDRLRAHFKTLRIASGAFLVLIGLLILLGRLQRFNVLLFQASSALQAWRESSPLQVRLFFAALLVVPAVLLIVSIFRRARAEGRLRFLPGRTLFAAGFLALTALTLGGVVDPTRFFTFWFTFQGI